MHRHLCSGTRVPFRQALHSYHRTTNGIHMTVPEAKATEQQLTLAQVQLLWVLQLKDEFFPAPKRQM